MKYVIKHEITFVDTQVSYLVDGDEKGQILVNGLTDEVKRFDTEEEATVVLNKCKKNLGGDWSIESVEE